MKSIPSQIAFAAIAVTLAAAGRRNIPAVPIQDSPFGNQYWMVASATIHPALDVDLDGKADTDLLLLVPPCERDDADRYLDDGTILTNRGPVNCDEDEEREEETGTWSYDPATKTLVMEKYDGSQPVEAHLESASAQQIVFVAKHRSSGATHIIRTTLKTKKM
ncbi:hypothetical protein [Parapedobacter koreensis]|uniref:Lipocalin-like domain-containing protein n=1 Tax=Parapedobacter koreensis TaxID=332977 RepID=A0A1H7QXW4_9SPHI|nr:hypothetical protein [Parapedobacter koreensis]SEL52826.1 hypothetical protein SAMN05421740_106170 [Parapedobacter koreensis]